MTSMPKHYMTGSICDQQCFAKLLKSRNDFAGAKTSNTTVGSTYTPDSEVYKDGGRAIGLPVSVSDLRIEESTSLQIHQPCRDRTSILANERDHTYTCSAHASESINTTQSLAHTSATMAGIVNSLLQLTNYKSAFLRTLIPSIGLAYGIQAAVAVPSILAQSERFYDASGSLTYISCTALSLLLPTLRARYAASATGTALPAWPSLLESLGKGGVHAWNWRQVVLSAAVTLWAARLGSFLYQRITSDDGKDSRFDDIRGAPAKFSVAFFAQATWVSLCLLPVLAVNSIPATALAALPLVTLTDILGLALFVGGISFEATADQQKSQWLKEKKEKKHSEDFLTRGLWSKSRHPNYFGESTLWTGIATAAAGVMLTNIGQSGMGFSGSAGARVAALAMAGVSPAFVTFLLLKVSVLGAS